MVGNNKQNGFTLIEVIVVVTLFLLIVSAVVGLFIVSTDAQRVAKTEQQVLREIRLAIEIVTKSIQSSYIDYGFYSPCLTSGIQTCDQTQYIVQPTSTLALLRPSGVKEVFWFDQENARIMQRIDDTDHLLTQQSAIDALSIYIQPVGSPYIAERCLVGGLGQNACLPQADGCSAGAVGSQGFCQCAGDGIPDDQKCRTGYCDSDSGLCLPSPHQPHVTLVVLARTATSSTAEPFVVQTTITSRVY